MTRSSLALSVLDLVPVSTDQTSTDAIAASMRTAELADRLGFTRYWFAAHHDMTAFAATTPPFDDGARRLADLAHQRAAKTLAIGHSVDR